MRAALPIAAIALGLLPSLLAFSALLGLGIHRQAAAWAISLSATLFVFGPPLVAASLARSQRAAWFGGFGGLWSLGILLALPVYFPTERSQAVITGLSLGGHGGTMEGMARAVASTLPEDPKVAQPEVPLAEALTAQVLTDSMVLADDEITLPYEGEGRRLSIDITAVQGEREAELPMMLDTGATYTTLPTSVLEQLGVRFTERDPVIHLATANGERDARVVVLDEVWLGHKVIRNVAIAVCEACASAETMGLLGLNVTGGFNLHINADSRDVTFASRKAFNRHLDVKPYTEVHATIRRFTGGRVEVTAELDNRADRPIASATAAVHCGEQRWLVEMGEVGVGETAEVRRRLPDHEPCSAYQVGLHAATW